MTTIKDARNILYLQNEYDANGRVFRQTQADSGIYQFAYTADAYGNVTRPTSPIRAIASAGLHSIRP